MARIAGIDLPNHKRLIIALTYIYGIGKTRAKKIVEESGLSPDARMHTLSEDDVAKLRTIIENNYMVEGNLRTKVAMDLKRLMDIGAYRGLRHRRGLPVRGQRTKNNSRTRKDSRGRSGIRRK